VDDAVDLALEQLGADEEDVEIEVLRQPDEPDEHGYVTDEALVRVTLRTADRAAASRPRGGERASRRQLTPGERMRVAQIGQEALSDLLHHLGLIASCRANAASVNTSEADAPVVLEVEGEDLGVLIGRRGENLDALQYILNLMVQKWTSTWPNISVDVAGYRKRREEVLESLARRMARRVIETQQPFTFEPMPARERRIVHLAVQEDENVLTESVGEGDERRVVIYLADDE
jgi:spoIIIJ-associated protein